MSAPWLPLAILGGLALSATVGDLISQEIRGRLDALARAVLRLAARRLPDDLHTEKLIEWEGELHEILRGTEALPVTRLWRGLRYAAGIVHAAPTIARTLTTQERSPRSRKDVRDLIRSGIRESIRTSVSAIAIVWVALLGAVAVAAWRDSGSSLPPRVLFVSGAALFIVATFSFVYTSRIRTTRASVCAAAVGVTVAAGDVTFLNAQDNIIAATLVLAIFSVGTAATVGAARRARRRVKARRTGAPPWSSATGVASLT